MQCANCHAIIEDGSVFCTSCGNKTAAPQQNVAIAPASIVCPICKLVNVAEADFCIGCGSVLKGPAYPAQPAVLGPSAPASIAAPVQKSTQNRGVKIFLLIFIPAAMLVFLAALLMLVTPLRFTLFPAMATDQAMAQASKLLDQKQYPQALAALQDIGSHAAEADKVEALRGTIRDNYREAVLSDAATLAGNGGFDDAIIELTVSLGVLKDDAVITAKISELQLDKKLALFRKQVYAQADNAIANSDFATAFQTMRSALNQQPGDADMAAHFAQYQDQYVNTIQTQADSMRTANQFNESEALMETAIALLPENSMLKDLLSSYQSQAISFSLFDFTPTSQQIMHETAQYWTGYSRPDCYGNQYSRGLYLEHYFNKSDTNFHSDFTYELNKEFHNMTGVFAADYTCNKAQYKKAPDYIMLEVYGDGKLLYKTPKATAATQPIKINVDVTDVKTLKLVVRCYAIDPDLFEFSLNR